VSEATQRYERSPAVLARRVGAELLLTIPGGEIVSLGGSGPIVWEALATPVTAPQAIEVVADTYGTSTDVVGIHVNSLLEHLVGKGLVREVRD
jgi:hypothetical protein